MKLQEDAGVLNLSEAAAFIRVSSRTMGEMARSRRVPCRRVGREWRFSREALVEWLAGKQIATAETTRETPVTTLVSEPLVQYEVPFAGFKDTAFAENRDRTLHRWVPWIAGYSGGFVADVLDRCSGGVSGLTVLDPFAGVGTTLVEALKKGHAPIGFEINPYAALACRVKTSAASYKPDAIRESVSEFRACADRWTAKSRSNAHGDAPVGFISRVPFFSPQIEKQVLFCLDFINRMEDRRMGDLFRVAIGAVMVGFSNYSYEPSLGTRAAAGKPNVENADVFGILAHKLEEMIEDVGLWHDRMSAMDRVPKARVYPQSFFDGAARLDAGSVDALITSPPYLNNYHYIRNTRPHMFWLGMVTVPGDLKEIEQKSFGQFWQTVRSGPQVPLEPEMPELTALIDDLRSKNAEKGPYGGPGWANYAATYFNDCARFCRQAHRLMRPGGMAVVVIGNNILQGIEFPTDRFFSEIAGQEGFEIVELHEVRKKRTGDSIVNSSVRTGTVKQRTRLYETAIEMRA